MTAIILNGKSLAKAEEQALRTRVENLKSSSSGEVPILATILVGNDPSSATYVKMKANACERVGMKSLKVELPETTTTNELLTEINNLNNNPKVHGILLQHPVPPQIDERKCFDSICLSKDVDGVTCLGFGRMSMQEQAFGSATPKGIMRILEAYNIPLQGKHAVVVGRSPILGKPMAQMLLNENCTVTICHSKTENLRGFIESADILIGAAGKPEFIKADWVKNNSVVIDAGYHQGGLGDIELDPLKNRVHAFTPVPGGVGPMTISTLIKQTVEAGEFKIRNTTKG